MEREGNGKGRGRETNMKGMEGMERKVKGMGSGRKEGILGKGKGRFYYGLSEGCM